MEGKHTDGCNPRKTSETRADPTTHCLEICGWPGCASHPALSEPAPDVHLPGHVCARSSGWADVGVTRGRCLRYSLTLPPLALRHKAHCVEHLRQLAMCSADLTPVPTQWFQGLGRNYINSSREHTCRDFSLVRQWATDRFNGSTAVKARNRDGKILPLRIAGDPADLGPLRQARRERKRWFRGALDIYWQSSERTAPARAAAVCPNCPNEHVRHWVCHKMVLLGNRRRAPHTASCQCRSDCSSVVSELPSWVCHRNSWSDI